MPVQFNKESSSCEVVQKGVPMFVVKKTFIEIEEGTDADEEPRTRTAPAAIYVDVDVDDESTDCESDAGKEGIATTCIASITVEDKMTLADAVPIDNTACSNSFSLATPRFVVKNTFVHIEDTESDIYRRVRSGPATFVDDGYQIRCPLDTIADLDINSDADSPATATAGKGVESQPQQVRSVVSPLGSSSAIQNVSEKAAKLAEKQRLHDLRECKPCAYFAFKADGCRLGDDCEYCHLCDKRDSRKREKQRAKALKNTPQPNSKKTSGMYSAGTSQVERIARQTMW